MNMIANW